MTALVHDYAAIRAARVRRRVCGVAAEAGGFMCECKDGETCAALARRNRAVAPFDPLAETRAAYLRLCGGPFWRAPR
ncbi:MAG TPA: hypothetical protein VE993_04560 [Stellaceae bacterium]|nr:hypothetical protein [Stellaceae bacterium]